MTPKIHLRAVFCCAATLLGTAFSAATALPAENVDLRGTWFVLIHYKDPASANSEATRWRDLVWSFSLKGSRLQWIEYPIVFFTDSAGRFEEFAGNPRSRVLEAWEPNPHQLKVIAEGPYVNSRGAKTKTLKGSRDSGWQSSQRRMQVSASVMSYQEILSIENSEPGPVFERRDVVGNSLSQSDGLTRYEVTEILQGGDTLLGRYDKDSRMKGSFRMWRTGAARALEKKDRTPNQRARDALLKNSEAEE